MQECNTAVLLFSKEELDSRSGKKNTSTGKRSYGEEGQLDRATNSYVQNVIELAYHTQRCHRPVYQMQTRSEEFLVRQEICDTPLSVAFTS